MSENLRAIAMRLSDENGPRGGEDKLCRIQASLAGAPPVVIEDVQSNLYVAIDRAADRLGRTVARRLHRQRRARRSLGRAGLADRVLAPESIEDLPQSGALRICN